MTEDQRKLAVIRLQEAASEERRCLRRYQNEGGDTSADTGFLMRAEAFEACIKVLNAHAGLDGD